MEEIGKKVVEKIEEVKEEVLEPTVPDIPLTEGEVVTGYRVVEILTYGKVRIYRPNFYVSEEADKIYSAERRKLLTESDSTLKLLSEKQLKKLLLESGDWTDKDDTELKDFGDKIAELQVEKIATADEMSKCEGDLKETKKKKLDELVTKISELLKKQLEKIKEKNLLFSDTIESYADYRRKQFLVINCTTYDAGNKEEKKYIWKNLNEFKKESLEVSTAIISEALKFWVGLSEEDLVHFFEEWRGSQKSD